MIKKFIDKLLGKSAPGTSGVKPHFGKREEVPASVHGINPELVDRRAVDVVRTLQDAGCGAYIVGGAGPGLLLEKIEPGRTIWSFKGYRYGLASQ